MGEAVADVETDGRRGLSELGSNRSIQSVAVLIICLCRCRCVDVYFCRTSGAWGFGNLRVTGYELRVTDSGEGEGEGGWVVEGDEMREQGLGRGRGMS